MTGGGAVSSGAGCRISTDRRGELDVVVVVNDVLSLTFAPQLGGRLISLVAGGRELLWRNPDWLGDDLTPVVPLADWPESDGTMGSWANVGGSKTWPAPQGWSGPGEWAGPPDPVLDSGVYACSHEVAADGSARIELTSADDERSGIRITRAFTVPATGPAFSQTDSFRNIGGRTVRWSVWEVTQIDTTAEVGGGRGEFAVGQRAGDPPVEMVRARGDLRYQVDERETRVPVQDVVGKLGFPAADGRIEWRHPGGGGLVQEVAVEPGADYPDGGCPVEIWMQYALTEPIADYGNLHPTAALAEMESLGPLVELAPGDRTGLTIRWTCRPS